MLTVLRVFTLNYILASDVDKVVKGLMSPLGQSFTNTTNFEEQRNADEQLVVEDLPAYLDRIADYIAQVNTMPRQVVVEAKHPSSQSLRQAHVNTPLITLPSGTKITGRPVRVWYSLR